MEAVKKPTTEKRSKWLMVLVRPSEHQRIKEAAVKEDVSVSALIRRAVLRDLARGPVDADAGWPEAAGR